jgi:L-serine dehydratase
MKEISLFDVIGPNMIGPSSSHTAGACRIAFLARKIALAPIKKVHFVLYGSFAKTYRGHGTDRALVAGILGMGPEDWRIKEAFFYAKESGLEYSFEENTKEKAYHPNTVEIHLTTIEDELVKIRGASVGGGNIKINALNEMEIEFTGEYDTLFIRQKDTKGIVAHITKALSEYSINIAFMKLYREAKGSIAYTITETDECIDEAVVERMKENENILDIKIIKKL